MENWTKLIAFFAILMFFLHSFSVSAQEVEEEREFEYKEGSEKGPEHWGKLKKEWAACNNGALQSPIDLSSQRVKIMPKLEELKRSYNPSNATIKNRGHDISVYWTGNAGSIQIDGVVYNLQQCHWHSPSEHSLNGRRVDLELHMVHMSSDKRIAVVGQLYTIGQPDSFLSKLSTQISGMINHVLEKEVGVMNPFDIQIVGKEYYRYLGSLTVPPCTEGVIWTINKKIMTVSMKQVQLLREVVHDYARFNTRPSQSLNKRQINFYRPT